MSRFRLGFTERRRRTLAMKVDRLDRLETDRSGPGPLPGRWPGWWHACNGGGGSTLGSPWGQV